MNVKDVIVQCRLTPVALALLAALLFGLNAPLSKLLLPDLTPMFMVAFLYLGAGAGMFVVSCVTRERRTEAPLSRNELPWSVAMVVLDVIAPFLLMWGLKMTSAANASLLFNFEMVTTSVIALVCFNEAVGRRMWFSIGIITLASVLLSIDFTDISAWRFSRGSLLVIAACGCWGMENNCTRNISAKSPAAIVVVKGFGSGLTALAIASLTGNPFPSSCIAIVETLLLGFVAYGLSIFLYIKAQRFLGAARTSAYYAAAPFMGVLLSMLIWRELPSWNFAIAVFFMLWGTWLAFSENHVHCHSHEALKHDHAHRHDDRHHNHVHTPSAPGWHSHEHTHAKCVHEHPHTPDLQHRHQHG